LGDKNNPDNKMIYEVLMKHTDRLARIEGCTKQISRTVDDVKEIGLRVNGNCIEIERMKNTAKTVFRIGAWIAGTIAFSVTAYKLYELLML